MSKIIQCPHKISISGLIRGCMLGFPPDTCESCNHPDKHYNEVKSSWASLNTKTGEIKSGED